MLIFLSRMDLSGTVRATLTKMLEDSTGETCLILANGWCDGITAVNSDKAYAAVHGKQRVGQSLN